MVRCTEVAGEKCPICFVDFPRNESKFALRLPCGHVFHGACVQVWLSKESTCPTCRRVQVFQVFHAVDPYVDGKYRPTIFPIKGRLVQRQKIVQANHRRVRSLFNLVLKELRFYHRHCWKQLVCFCHGQPNAGALADAAEYIQARFECVEDIEGYFDILP